MNVRAILAVVVPAVWLCSAASAEAFTLFSPLLTPPSGGSIRCLIFNFASATKGMSVTIDPLKVDGTVALGDGTSCGINTAGHISVCSNTPGPAVPVACRFTVTGVATKDVRATVETFDSSRNPVTVLEAH